MKSTGYRGPLRQLPGWLGLGDDPQGLSGPHEPQESRTPSGHLAEPPGWPRPDLTTIRTRDLARVLSVSEATVRAYMRQGMPYHKIGRWTVHDARLAIAWFVDRLKAGGDAAAEEREATARYRRAKAERAEMEAAKRAGELVDRETVRRLLLGISAAAGPLIDGVAGRLAGELAAESDPAVVRARLHEEGRRVRNETADAVEQLARDLHKGG